MSSTAHPGPPTHSRPAVHAGPTGQRRPPTQPAPVPVAALDLLESAEHGLVSAALAATAAERYARAHLSALRSAAAVLAVRARPDGRGRRGPQRPRSAWAMLPAVAPELGEWAAYFAAGAGKRAAAEAGITRVVSEREADDLLRDAETFLGLARATLGLPTQAPLPSAVCLVPAGV